MADPTSIAQHPKRVEAEHVRRDAELSRKHADAAAGAGMVRVRVDGHGTLRALEIDPTAFEGRDAALLADLIMSAISEAQRRVDTLGGDTLPGLRESAPSE